MKAKEVLHYYLGQEVSTDSGSETLDAIYNNGDIETLFRGHLRNYYSLERVKPILRPLSDMTEEELREMCDKANVGYRSLESFKIHFSQILFPAEFHYLLSHGFDLFGLIESGEAIKKEK